MPEHVVADDVDDETWDAQVLRSLPAGIDVTLIEERLALAPTQRLERMIAVLRLIDEARTERDD